jgi:hypothetical protein
VIDEALGREYGDILILDVMKLDFALYPTSLLNAYARQQPDGLVMMT